MVRPRPRWRVLQAGERSRARGARSGLLWRAWQAEGAGAPEKNTTRLFRAPSASRLRLSLLATQILSGDLDGFCRRASVRETEPSGQVKKVKGVILLSGNRLHTHTHTQCAGQLLFPSAHLRLLKCAAGSGGWLKGPGSDRSWFNFTSFSPNV